VARPKFNFAVLDPGSGRAQPGAWVSVYLANTLTLATLYADDDVSTLANPVQANQLGQVAMRVNPGIYDVSMVWDGAQPTVVEDVLAWTPEAAVLTTPGDLLVGTAAGPKALHVGLENQLLVVDQGLPVWRTLASNDGVPAGATGSLLVYGTSGGVQVILPGTQDQALAMAGGTPTWVSSLIPAGTTLPINQPGDLVYGAPSTGLAARLPVGALGSMLTVSDNATLIWSPSGAVGPGVGQCYLSYENTQSLWLAPHKGNRIWVNGVTHTIPDNGVRLTPVGLSLHTNYYIYLAWTGTELALEASTTGWHQTGGLMHKFGDMSRTLVGFARVLDESYVGGSASVPIWMDTEKYRCVLSFFNQDERVATGFFTAPRSLSSTPAAVEVHGEIRCYFIAWGFTNLTMSMTGSVYSTATFPIAVISYLALDDTVIQGMHLSAMNTGARLNLATGTTKTLAASDTLHSLSIHGLVQAGGGATWEGDAGGQTACRVSITIAT
jgi:hypothetical protein